MKRLAFLIVLVAGCSRSNVHDVQFAIDPTTGLCTPLAGGTAPHGWASCADPCAPLDARACRSDVRCQVVQRAGTNSCQAVPQVVDPCKSLDAVACAADSRCAMQPSGGGCACPAGAVCDCPAPPPAACGLKFCGDITDADACNARPDCTTTPPAPVPTPVATGVAQPKSLPAAQCFPINGCDLGERDCAKRHECMRSYDEHDTFTGCGSTDHCNSADDCALGMRCNDHHACVVEGCAGESETECNADRHCEPIYSLDCSPYANGGGGGVGPASGVICGGASGGGGAPPLPQEAPAPGSCTCEPTFTSCQPQANGCDPGKSVLVRDPAILDDAYWALPRVLGVITGADASAVADAWLAQLGATITVDGKTVSARAGAAQFIAALPHRSDGLVDATRLGFVPTALSNRLDLADGASCGEARVTYALALGATDRRHRMTVIVELRQPYDGNHCRTVAQRWIDLAKLDGAALQAALQAIYAPLLTPANLKQVRTNEFLVGPQDSAQPPAAWELREFHLGADARLHQSLLPLQVDAAAAQSSPDFLAWAQTNRDALANGSVTFPLQYQVPTASEDGSRIALSDGSIADLVNRSTCAGCHTTATNSAFAHVAERFGGSGRAEISQFLEGELGKRASHLAFVAAGLADAPLAIRPLH